jgi:hypothetical protein
MTTGSLGEYAAHRKVSQPYVTKLKKQGRLVLVQVDGRELVDFERSDRLVEDTTDQGRARNGDNARPQPAEASAPEDTPAPGAAVLEGGGGGAAAPEGPDVGAIFRKAQAQERVYNAKTAELAYRKAVGELVDRATTERTVFDLFRVLRDQAFNVPQRAAARVIGLADVNEVERILAEELRRAFDTWEQRATDRLAARGQK